MTAIVMGHVNAVYTLGRAHRRQLLAACALSERSLLIRGLSFPRTKTIGDVYIDDLVTLQHFAILMTHTSIRRPLKCSVPMTCTISSKSLQMRACQAVRSRESFGKDAWMASQEHSDSLLNEEFRSCLSRYCFLQWT